MCANKLALTELKIRLPTKFLSLRVFRLLSSFLLLFPQMFRLIYPPAIFRCLSNSGAFMELRTTSFIESMGVACSNSVSHNRIQVLSIPVLLLACSEDWTWNLQMIVSLDALGSRFNPHYRRVTIQEYLTPSYG